jgi:hypothetical protein
MTNTEKLLKLVKEEGRGITAGISEYDFSLYQVITFRNGHEESRLISLTHTEAGQLRDWLNKELPVCPLCNKPSPNNEPHTDCADREVAQHDECCKNDCYQDKDKCPDCFEYSLYRSPDIN